MSSLGPKTISEVSIIDEQFAKSRDNAKLSAEESIAAAMLTLASNRLDSLQALHPVLLQETVQEVKRLMNYFTDRGYLPEYLGHNLGYAIHQFPAHRLPVFQEITEKPQKLLLPQFTAEQKRIEIEKRTKGSDFGCEHRLTLTRSS